MFCRLTRWRIDRALDEGEELVPGLQAHLWKCSGCRLYYEARVGAEAELEREAGRERAKVPPDLAERAVVAYRAARASSTRTARGPGRATSPNGPVAAEAPMGRRRMWRWVPAALAACVCLAVLAGRARRERVRQARIRKQNRVAAQQLLDFKEALFAPVAALGTGKLPTLSREQAARIPLAAELDGFRADAAAIESFLLDRISVAGLRRGK